MAVSGAHMVYRYNTSAVWHLNTFSWTLKCVWRWGGELHFILGRPELSRLLLHDVISFKQKFKTNSSIQKASKHGRFRWYWEGETEHTREEAVLSTRQSRCSVSRWASPYLSPRHFLPVTCSAVLYWSHQPRLCGRITSLIFIWSSCCLPAWTECVYSPLTCAYVSVLLDTGQQNEWV